MDERGGGPSEFRRDHQITITGKTGDAQLAYIATWTKCRLVYYDLLHLRLWNENELGQRTGFHEYGALQIETVKDGNNTHGLNICNCSKLGEQNSTLFTVSSCNSIDYLLSSKKDMTI